MVPAMGTYIKSRMGQLTNLCRSQVGFFNLEEGSEIKIHQFCHFIQFCTPPVGHPKYQLTNVNSASPYQVKPALEILKTGLCYL